MRFATILPTDGNLTTEHHKSVRAAINDYTDRFDISNAEAAKQIGISSSALSQYRNGKYKGDNNQAAYAINNWIERDGRARASRVTWEYVPTQIAQNMRSVVRLAYEQQRMAVMVCPSGAGKTMTLKALTDEMRGAYMRCRSDMTPRKFILSLAIAIGLSKNTIRSSDMLDSIIFKLRGTSRPIFLDEAHLLPLANFDHIRAIYDEAEVPIIMAGTDEIIHRVDDRGCNRGQMHSRCIIWNALEGCADAEHKDGSKMGRPLFTIKEIEQFFKQRPLKLTPGSLQLLWGIACLPSRGCIRTVLSIVDTTARLFPDQSIDREKILQVMCLFYGQEGKCVMDLAKVHIKRFGAVA